jgi:hypothetical protein
VPARWHRQGWVFTARTLRQRHASAGNLVRHLRAGGILYLAVTGRPPEESTVRAFENCMPSAMEGAAGGYRRAFVAAIDACLRMRHAERPQSVTQLRQMLFSTQLRPHWADRLFTRVREPIQRSASILGQIALRWPVSHRSHDFGDGREATSWMMSAQQAWIKNLSFAKLVETSQTQ